MASVKLYRGKYSIPPTAEPDTGHADLDVTSRVGLRDILFNYTGRVDMSLYRKMGSPMSVTQQHEDGSVAVDTLNPDFSPAVDEFSRGPETRMDDYDFMRDYQLEDVNRFHEKLADPEPADGSDRDSDGANPVPASDSES